MPSYTYNPLNTIIPFAYVGRDKPVITKVLGTRQCAA